MAASRARLEALLARVQKRAREPRVPSAAVAPILEAVKGGASRGAVDAVAAASAASEAPASVRAPRSGAAPNVAEHVVAHNAVAQNEVDDDIEEYDDELIEIIDDAEVIPQAAAVARAIEPAAFGAAVDRRPASPIRSEPVPGRAASPRPLREALQSEAVAARPIAATEVARARGAPRELRHASFVELLDASLKLG